MAKRAITSAAGAVAGGVLCRAEAVQGQAGGCKDPRTRRSTGQPLQVIRGLSFFGNREITRSFELFA